MATGFGVGHQLKSFVTIYARSHARYALIGTSQHRGCVKIGRVTRHCFFPTKEIKWILHTFSEAARCSDWRWWINRPASANPLRLVFGHEAVQTGPLFQERGS